MIIPVGALPEHNPLLEIDLSFSAYLSARTRSFKEHVLDGKLDYAFDADFSLRQKINGMPGWAKIHKKLVNTDIPNKYKSVFKSSSAASPLLYPNAFDAALACAAHLKMTAPAVYVRNIPDKLEIYSMGTVNAEECVVITSALYEACNKEELTFLIGRECGHIQNNHSAYTLAAAYFDKSGNDDERVVVSVKPIEAAFSTWLDFSTVTADRAGIICLDAPLNFLEIFNSLYSKGLILTRKNSEAEYGEELDTDKLNSKSAVLRKTPSRSIAIEKEFTVAERRALAGLEFLNCDALFSWRADLDASGVHTISKQALEIRCDAILFRD
ncbi:MAG: M48 family metalloprotease [Oscillospiraceae bacterium]|nr:M48 family metalloprotease [Oscillospiraceae bacterium]